MKHLIPRIAIFLLGVFLIAFGVAISVRADLGTAPIASLPAVLSMATPVTVGVYLMTLNLVFVACQAILLRRKFQAFQLIQIPLAVAFGGFVDLCMYLTSWIQPTSYLEQWGWLVLSVVVLAVGVYVEMQPRLTYLPGNGIVFVLYSVLQNIPYGTVKVLFDSILVASAAGVSLIVMGGFFGVREGTIVAALSVGLVIRALSMLHRRISRRVVSAEAASA